MQHHTTIRTASRGVEPMSSITRPVAGNSAPPVRRVHGVLAPLALTLLAALLTAVVVLATSSVVERWS
jgi:hypothetical protein